MRAGWWQEAELRGLLDQPQLSEHRESLRMQPLSMLRLVARDRTRQVTRALVDAEELSDALK